MIKRIRLSNFYSFQEETVDLHPETNILIGINSSGKSNFLKAVRLLQEGFSDAGLADYVARTLGTFDNIYFKGLRETQPRPTVSIEYTLDFKKINPTPKGPFHEDLIYTVTLVRSPSVQNYFVEERLTGSVPKADGTLFEYLSFSNGSGVVSERDPEARSPKRIRYNDYDPQQLALSKINDSDRYWPQDTVRRALRDIVVYDYFDTTANSPMRQAIIPRADRRLMRGGANLAQILHNIRYTNRSDYERLKDAAAEVSPHLHEFSANILAGGTIELALGEDGLNSFVHVSGISDGTLRYLCLLSILYNSERGRFICIDEPEVGLHPDMIFNITKAVRHASITSTIVLSTHSVALLSQFDLENIRVFEKDGINASVVKRYAEEDFTGWYEEFNAGSMWQAGDLGGRRYG